MLTSNKSIDKIESLQKKSIRLLMGLPRISHTAEAFWTYVMKFLIQFKGDQLPPTFKKDSYYQKISKTQILETEMIFIF